MASAFWQQVLAGGLAVPPDRPLDDMTAELTTLLGSPDPAQRDGLAYPTLEAWIRRGVYDDLLAGLGDGMATGLDVGLGERDTDSVFRRSFSALVLGDCIARDTVVSRLPGTKIMEWGDRIASWFLRERDLRGWVPNKGWAHALAHGSDAIGALAESPRLGPPELTVMLDVLADRLLLPAPGLLQSGEPDRLAAATMRVLRRNVVPLKVLEPWVARIVAGATAHAYDMAVDPYQTTGDAEAFLRALYLQLSLAPAHPSVRSDLLLVLVDALRTTNPRFLAVPRQ
ncbi:DUF2785 domain-containing protein [Nocardioides speluncae]|uniref:DUF2785 domain-containing protein n=1 Tax=Nocardioides speluncae TaxID=2670337 RepID=UPI000D69E807|nr:DUF2785 domain-containing protein [Nocardioides speluncae]